MKRLKLNAFKTKNVNKKTQQATDKLLGQVLGDCHDDSNSNKKSNRSYCAGSGISCQGEL